MLYVISVMFKSPLRRLSILNLLPKVCETSSLSTDYIYTSLAITDLTSPDNIKFAQNRLSFKIFNLNSLKYSTIGK